VESPRTPQLTPAHSRTQSLEAETFFGGGSGGAGGPVDGGGGGGVGGGGVYSYSLGAEQRSATLEMGQQKEVIYNSVRQVQQGNAVMAGLEDAHRRMQVCLLLLISCRDRCAYYY